MTDSWREFYFMCGSAAAGLTGLMFFAVTFGSALIRKEKMPQVDLFLSSICYHFVQVFFFCCVALVPTAGSYVLGACVMTTGFVRLLKIPRHHEVMKSTARDGNSGVEMSDWIGGLIIPGLLYLILMTTGALYLLDNPAAATFLAFSIISLLMLGMRSAWDMLIWIAAGRNEQKIESTGSKN